MTVLDMDRIRNAIHTRQPGRFHLSDLYGEEWHTLWIGDKVKAGNEFQRRVAQREFPLVEDTGEKASEGRIYNRRSSQ